MRCLRHAKGILKWNESFEASSASLLREVGLPLELLFGGIVFEIII